MVPQVGQDLRQPALVPAHVPLGSEEDGPLVVVHSMDVKSPTVKKGRDFRADKTTISGNEKCGDCSHMTLFVAVRNRPAGRHVVRHGGMAGKDDDRNMCDS
jgi:hypothetical protein